jgi:hypothetical protein
MEALQDNSHRRGGGKILAAAEADVMFGTVQEKVLARFSPMNT